MNKNQPTQLFEYWNRIHEYLIQQFPKDQELWLDYIECASEASEQLLICVPNELYKERFNEKYLSLVEQFIQSYLDIPFKIVVILQREKSKYLQSSQTEINQTIKSNSDTTTRIYPSLKVANQNKTFAQFVVGNNSQLAYAASIRIADYPGQEYNPFFLYGGVGLGKTHLMQAIGNKVKEQDSKLLVVYVTSEQFTNDFVTSVQKGRMHSFRLKYRNTDVLLVDDIQFLEGKEGIQEELFHTFNILKESQKQMVFTSDRPPKELKTITDRLLSRFASGLVADIKPPDRETRKAILRNKLIKCPLPLSEDIIDFLAINITNNVRDLEAAIIKIKSLHELLKEELTILKIEEYLQDILNYNIPQNISVERIQKEVATYYNISYRDMMSKKRSGNISKPRQMAIYLTKIITNLTTKEIGNEFGGRNHSTVIFSYQKIMKEIKTNQSTQNDIEHLKNRLLTRNEQPYS